MTLLIRSLRGTVRLAVLGIAFAVVAWAVADDARPAEANHTKIVVSKSATCSNPVTSIILPKNGSPRDFYVCALNVHNSNGASAFDVRFDFNPTIGSITFMEWYGPPAYSCAPSNPSTCWIGSSGRNPSCLGAIGPNAGLALGEAYAQCNTFLTPPPYGALGSGKLVHFRFQPGTQLMSNQQLDLRDSFLVNTPPNPADQQPIAASAPLLFVTISKCADFDMNGTIDLVNDIFGVALRFGMTSSHPQWNSIYDLDDNGAIDLVNDIFNTAFQFGGSC